MNIQVIKSRRRTIGIEVHADGKVIVRTPLFQLSVVLYASGADGLCYCA